MNKIIACAALATWLAGISTTQEVYAQGSLTPPGPPTPAMRTLEQIEPRTPITNLPYTITQPGSYYLTGNLTSTGYGIVVEAGGVTVDLMGFTIAGDGDVNEMGVSFISGSGLRGVVVRNGIVRGFDRGLDATRAMDCRFEGLALSGNIFGALLDGTSGQCSGNVFDRCVVSSNRHTGLYFQSSGGQSIGNRIVDCVIAANSSNGVVFSGNSGPCSGNAIVESTLEGNGECGVQVLSQNGRCEGNLIRDCTISSNRLEGIRIDSFSGQCVGNTAAGCSIRGNGRYGVCLKGGAGQCSGNTLTDCTVATNGNHGVHLWAETGSCSRNLIEKCRVMDNAQRGVYLSGSGGTCEGNIVRDCTIGGNAGIGLSLYYANGGRLQGNLCQGQRGAITYGLQTASCERNLVVANTCIGHTSNFDLSANDTYGPIVTSSGALPTSGDGAHPWANFSR